jgi:hypothetical protein
MEADANGQNVTLVSSPDVTRISRENLPSHRIIVSVYVGTDGRIHQPGKPGLALTLI